MNETEYKIKVTEQVIRMMLYKIGRTASDDTIRELAELEVKKYPDGVEVIKDPQLIDQLNAIRASLKPEVGE